MSLPTIAKRIDLIAYAPGPLTDPPEFDQWQRHKRGPAVQVAAWKGDIQPRSALARPEDPDGSAPPAADAYLILAEPTPAILTGHWVVRKDDPAGTVWNVDQSARLGEGMALDHLELACTAVTSPIEAEA